jgi:hypothetical protein
VERLESAYASVGVYILSRCALREALVETVHPGTFRVNGFSVHSQIFNFGIYTCSVSHARNPNSNWRSTCVTVHLRALLRALGNVDCS